MQNNVLQLTSGQFPTWLNNFIEVYQSLSVDNLNLLEAIYHEDITFIDPIHEVKGFNKLHDYFKGLYENLSQCRFVINEVIVNENVAAIYWEMNYVHPKLNKGKAVKVSGNSLIKGRDNKVIYHKDYLDLGVMLYEQLPLLGKVIKWVKIKAAN